MKQRKILLFFLIAILISSCTKEVEIDIPGYKEQLVVDGRIETNSFPIVLLSRSSNIYSETDLNSYLQSFVADASVSVSNGQQTVQLQLFNIADLPLQSQKTLAEMLTLELNEAIFIPIQVYSTTDPTILGEVGKTYTLHITDQGKEYSGETVLLPPVHLANRSWKPELSNPEYGLIHATLSDPADQYNAYKWETKRININDNGQEMDDIFKKGSGAYFDDQFFNGLTFDFDARNHQKRKDSTHLEEYKRFYRLGDSAVIKFSRLDRSVFEFFDKKSAQLESSGNPFSTPVNVPSNIVGGALGIWAGVSPWYDTLYCVE